MSKNRKCFGVGSMPTLEALASLSGVAIVLSLRSLRGARQVRRSDIRVMLPLASPRAAAGADERPATPRNRDRRHARLTHQAMQSRREADRGDFAKSVCEAVKAARQKRCR
jgi:hypothetical protein